MDGLLLNVGCGDYQAEGWVNLDVDPDIEPDIVADLRKLPDSITGVQRVYLGHVLHDLPPHDVPPALADLWERCVSGCEVLAVGPDLVKVWDQVFAGNLTEQDATVVSGPRRRWACSEQRLLDLMRVSGLAWAARIELADARTKAFPVVSRIGWQCAVYGVVR